MLFCNCKKGNQTVSNVSVSSIMQNNDSLKRSMLPFKLKTPDTVLSPYTGMNRQSWIEAGIHILKGAFQYVDSIKTPMFLPKFPGKSYPARGNKNATEQERSAAIFEAIARTFNIAAPILQEQPDLTLNGIKVKEYYKYHLLQLLTNPESYYYIGDKPLKPSQQTCELGNLALWNLIAPNAFWNQLNQDEKDKVAKTTANWAGAWTKAHNWRYFNVMMFTFLHYYGYEIDKQKMLSHLDNLILHYVGNGWYRDTGYDYYNMHVFHLYGAVWVEKYGKKYAPERAAIINNHYKEFSDNYPMIFGRNAEINMYGRSILYRLGANAAMPAAFFTDRDTKISPGLARRVSSGSLLQFITRNDFFVNGIPSLGFYGPFDYCIQPYSCSASPYWMFIGFSALTLPQNHPYWTDKEEMGHWEDIKKNQVYNKFVEGAGLLLSNHGSSGASEIRPGKISKQNNPNYSRLTYSTLFPWEAASNDGIISSQITLKSGQGNEKPETPNHVDIGGYRNHVLYRQASFKYRGNYRAHVDMASIIIPGGEIRVDRIRKASKSTYYLGHFSMPFSEEPPEITKNQVDGKTIITIHGKNRKLALTNYLGWDNLGTVYHEGLHPENKKSILLYAEKQDLKYEYGPVEVLVSVLLNGRNNKKWTPNELQPIKKVEALTKNTPMHLGGLKIELKNGKSYTVDFKNIDASSSRY